MPERFIEAAVIVPASLAQVWECWTTEVGITSFFAPACRIELAPGGPYEIYFDPQAPEGQRGGEGLKVLAIQEYKLLSFTWNAPPNLPQVRDQRTAVAVRLKELDPNQTQVTLYHTLWGSGGEWDQAFNYFDRAWKQIVLPRLKWRFVNGPVDWNAPPTPDELIS